MLRAFAREARAWSGSVRVPSRSKPARQGGRQGGRQSCGQRRETRSRQGFLLIDPEFDRALNIRLIEIDKSFA
ncbi:hypothetical protein D7S86_10675 [Pararobbsia silviterrae]|uniref:Uncharacterized protein n=1 Tax=Pararobbsia silviterrae TaxID=1792498 RepID=A0A494XYM1_9BURK|nr:hypothetical protein D7S86_10675 [Pararobbsia silviterrae]